MEIKTVNERVLFRIMSFESHNLHPNLLNLYSITASMASLWIKSILFDSFQPLSWGGSFFRASERTNTGWVTLSILHNKSYSPERGVHDVNPLFFSVPAYSLSRFYIDSTQQNPCWRPEVPSHNQCRWNKFDQIWATEVPTPTNQTCQGVWIRVPQLLWMQLRCRCYVWAALSPQTFANNSSDLERKCQLSAVEMQVMHPKKL